MWPGSVPQINCDQSFGYAASCEEWLGLSAGFPLLYGLSPSVRLRRLVAIGSGEGVQMPRLIRTPCGKLLA